MCVPLFLVKPRKEKGKGHRTLRTTSSTATGVKAQPKTQSKKRVLMTAQKDIQNPKKTSKVPKKMGESFMISTPSYIEQERAFEEWQLLRERQVAGAMKRYFSVVRGAGDETERLKGVLGGLGDVNADEYATISKKKPGLEKRLSELERAMGLQEERDRERELVEILKKDIRAEEKKARAEKEMEQAFVEQAKWEIEMAAAEKKTKAGYEQRIAELEKKTLAKSEEKEKPNLRSVLADIEIERESLSRFKSPREDAERSRVSIEKEERENKLEALIQRAEIQRSIQIRLEMLKRERLEIEEKERVRAEEEMKHIKLLHAAVDRTWNEDYAGLREKDWIRDAERERERQREKDRDREMHRTAELLGLGVGWGAGISGNEFGNSLLGLPPPPSRLLPRDGFQRRFMVEEFDGLSLGKEGRLDGEVDMPAKGLAKRAKVSGLEGRHRDVEELLERGRKNGHEYGSTSGW